MAESGLLRGTLAAELDVGRNRMAWVFRDDRFSRLSPPDHGLFKGMSVVDPQDTSRTGVIEAAVDSSGKSFVGAAVGSRSYNLVWWRDHTYDWRGSQDVYRRTYRQEAIRHLQTGDTLTVFHPLDEEVVVWAGFVRLIEERVSVPLMPNVTADRQVDVEPNHWHQWFLRNYPATLLPA
jgi:hypothetical protein